ncbi:MAG TPA: hypothetical protein VMF68_02675 [Spirochaetia bacterium]|nr:hypothetical protein [Spirochaetia bacterium]
MRGAQGEGGTRAGSAAGPVTIVVRDPSHLDAHRPDFLVSLETALEWARSWLEESPRREGEERLERRAPRTVGLTGLALLHPWSRRDFWARRVGRRIPSHLVVGRKHPTRWLCVWGAWRDPGTFELHTLYPGRAAPREIHDPTIDPGDLPAALRFWTRHAIVVVPGEWEAPQE